MPEPLPLSRANLAGFDAAVERPGYALDAVATGIVHLGLGGFHRAHMARYTHDLMQLEPEALQWGIAGAGMRPSDLTGVEALRAQDRLYTLMERQDEQETATIVGSLSQILFAGESSREVLEAIDNPAVRIVSSTVTENGYCLNPATKALNPDHPLIQQDLAGDGDPVSVVGILVEAYRRRRAAGAKAFTTLCCDNIQNNGHIVGQAVLALARLRDPTLADWIGANASFPNTMVDRITPVTTQREIDDLASRFGVADRWPVASEMFRQWVIEDNFVQGRPAWERVGTQFVPDVAPYEMMKLRLLNASHLAISGLGQLTGYVFVDEAMRDEAFRTYMGRLMDRETGPTLPDLPGVDLSRYKQQLIERFANHRINDTLQRVNTDAPLNLLLDPILDRLSRGQDCQLLTLGLAAWIRRMRRLDDKGGAITVVHPLSDQLHETAMAMGEDPRPMLEIRSLFGDLADRPRFVAELEAYLRQINAQGARATLVDLLHRQG